MNSLSTLALDAVPARPEAAVRVLHTSDWHLGVTVRDERRDVDHENVIAEIIGVTSAVGPDAIVHTGDLFNNGRPAMADFGRAIRALRKLGEIAPVVVLAGNHDSATALETLGIAVGDPVPEQVAEDAYDPMAVSSTRIRVMHRPATADHGAVLTLPARTGGRLRVAGLPFLHANRILGDFDDILGANATYADSVRKICDLLANSAFGEFDTAADVAVFASHLHVASARTSTEKEIHVSSEYATDPAHIDGGYGYLAFGHIHIAQAVAGNRGRYAGSILEIDFGEEGETKQVVVADLTPGRPTKIYDVALTAGRRIHRIRAPYSALTARAAGLRDGLVEVTVEHEPKGDEGADHDTTSLDIPGYDTLTAAVHAALPDACVVSVVDARRPDVNVADEVEVPEVTETPTQLFRGWFAENGQALVDRHDAHGADPERVASLFDEIHTAVTTESDVEVAERGTIAALIGEDGGA
ncbi:MAG: metallophosphoesterase [Acidimicrobiaceae bacterium]|nr:metallophosphoesterase [Acidimicrobiaceae bacterium]